MRMDRRRILTGFAAAALAAPMLSRSAFAQNAPPLSFSAIPDEDATKLVERFTKVAKYLEGRLGVPVAFVPVKSYPAAVTAFRNNQVQLAWFGGLSGVQARLALPGSVALAQGEEDKAFVTYFIAHASTGLMEEKDFPIAAKSKSFTFGAKTSTSGRLMPEYEIRRNTKLAPEAFFSRVGYSGDHTKSAPSTSPAMMIWSKTGRWIPKSPASSGARRPTRIITSPREGISMRAMVQALRINCARPFWR
jgi:phosphonate transport system substrate-binding protein